ncbi:MAG: translocation/assembly module TamB domain-containing protein [Acidobacteriota bacterium]
MQMTADAISLPEFAQVVPAVAGILLQPSLNAKVEGPLDRLAANIAIRSAAGDVKGDFVADLALPDQAIRGELSISHFDVAPVVRQATLKTDVTAIVKSDLHAASLADLDTWRGTIAITTPRVSGLGYAIERLQANAKVMGRSVDLDGTVDAYRAAASFRGRVAVQNPQRPLFDVLGSVRHVNLAALPRQLKLPSTVTDLNTSYHVTGTGTEQIRGDLRLADSDIAGARLASASTVSVSMKTTPHQPLQVDYQADVTASNVDLQRVGKEFGIPALDDGRYHSELNVHVTAAGRGTSPAVMQVTLCGELTDSTLLGGQAPQLAFDATVDRDAVHLKAKGSVDHLDPGVASGRAQLEGIVAGSFDAEATLTNLSAGFDLDHLDGTATLSLSPSTVGGLDIERASVDAQYQQQVVAIRTLDAAGPDLMLQGSGMVDLTPNGASNLKVHAESSNLETIGKLIDQPLKGIVTVEATVTGNRRNARASGMLTAGDLNAAGVDALMVAGDFTVDVPSLSAADATVSAMTKVNFVTIGGQQIDELAATTHYAQSQVDVDITARQAARTMNAGGTVVLHPGAQELRLTQLELSQQDLQWRLASGTEATIRYDGGLTTVKDLQLVSGEQQITADGTFGASNAVAHEPLAIGVKNLNLSNVDAVLLRPPQFSGVLNASATIAGTAEAPQAEADFDVTSGGFRNFHYESLKGTASFNGSGLTVDSELRQNPTASLRVNGYIPAAALRTPAPGTPTAASSPDRGFDLHVQSTPVDLGIVQGFTTALTNVTGTAQATIDVTGPADDPQPRGTILLTNGGFAVDATGVAYTGLTGRIDLQDDRVHIAELNLYDTSSATLSLTGDIPIRRALTGDVTCKSPRVISRC